VLTLLLLADSRLPSGGHGHSGGVEALVDRELVRSADDLALFLDGRVRTGGRVLAAAAAAGCALARQCAAAAAADVPADQALDSPRGDRRRSEGASEPPHVAIRCAVAEAASTDWAR
jgi:urease accessory protein UreF